ncbi:MAG: 1,4-alpha-glucan branching protein [Chitinophagaceae bacterium]|nr:1,4-alpha-glucan branching protein [Chitinophagaceae bacterium]
MDKREASVGWSKGANVYEVNIRQYTPEGNFRAFSTHLPRLKDMGVRIIWLMPVTPIGKEKRLETLGSYYACSSYVQVNEEFGTLKDFKELVQQVHELGMYLIIDWVANHTGWDHHWTKEHSDWYVKDADGNFTEKNGWTDVIDLDYAQPGLRLAMIDAMAFWVRDMGIDGFRCDMAHLVPLDFWVTARQHCDAIKPLYWLAECEQTEYYQAFDTMYAWHWMHVSEKFSKGEQNLRVVREVLEEHARNTPAEKNRLFFTSNHDENSWNGTEYEKYGTTARAWAVFCSTWPGMPLVYSGQENANAKRLKFFSKDELNWQVPTVLHDFYQRLFRLRERNAAVAMGQCRLLNTSADDQLLVYVFEKSNQRVWALLNVARRGRAAVTIEDEALAGKYRQLFSELDYTFSARENFELMEGEYLVYESIQ